MSNITSIDEYKPHFASFDPVTRNAHVIPVELVENIINGRIELSECDEPESMVRALLHSLLIAEGVIEHE